jgi:hypothetical protein
MAPSVNRAARNIGRADRIQDVDNKPMNAEAPSKSVIDNRFWIVNGTRGMRGSKPIIKRAFP